MKQSKRAVMVAAVMVAGISTASWAAGPTFGTIRYYPIRYSTMDEGRPSEKTAPEAAPTEKPIPEVVPAVDPAKADDATIRAWILLLSAGKEEVRQQARANLTAAKDRAVDPLVRRLQVGSTAVRQVLIAILDDMKTDLADEAMAEIAVCDHRNAVSSQALMALRDKHSVPGRQRLLDLVMTPDRELRKSAAYAIRSLGDPQCIDDLIKELEKQVTGAPTEKPAEAAKAATTPATTAAAKPAIPGEPPDKSTPVHTGTAVNVAVASPGTKALAPAALALNAVTSENYGQNVKKWKDWWEGRRQRYQFPANQIH